MIYAISDLKCKWVILKGWLGCKVGQGNILESDIEEEHVQQKMRKFKKNS